MLRDDPFFEQRNSLYCERKIVSVLRAWRFGAMVFVQQSLLEQCKETAEQQARKQRIQAIVRRLKHQWEPWPPAPQRPDRAPFPFA